MKSIKCNGFTLVELLAVIVILGVIALIITPVIRDTIDNSKKKNFINSAYQLVKAADIYYLENDMMGEKISEITFEFPNKTGNLEIKGAAPRGGNMTINENGDVALAVTDGNYCARKGFKDNEIITSKDNENCYIYNDTILNGANPELKKGMIPVIIEPDGKVLKSNDTSKWYDYSAKEWANAITVTEETRQKYIEADEGSVIKEEDILTYFVWVPRYKYKLWYVESTDGTTSTDSNKIHSIDIVFENKYTEKSQGTNNGEYLTHPAFTFGNEELNGIWIGKFEPSYSGATSKEEAQISIADSNKVLIKPNLYSWTNINLNNSFYTAKNMNANNNIFGFTKDSDIHIMKNTEWGAVAYLSHSIYGTNTAVYNNNNNFSLTGCGGDTMVDTVTTVCKNKYGTKYNNIYSQSTTGNISGIFDMSGGSLEHVMTIVINNGDLYYNTGFDSTTFPDYKYFDFYSDVADTRYSKRILGDATGEMGPFYYDGSRYRGSWYEDLALFPTSTSTIIVRGGNYNNSQIGGIFNFSRSSYSNTVERTFRVVIS